jgi:hypothetical protein
MKEIVTKRVKFLSGKLILDKGINVGDTIEGLGSGKAVVPDSR